MAKDEYKRRPGESFLEYENRMRALAETRADPRTYEQRFREMIREPAALERIEEARPEEVAEMVRLRKEGMQGLTAPQYAVAREQMMSQQGAAEQMAQRQLARQQAISGIRGGAATKQSGRLAQQLAQQRAQQEQQLFMTDVGEKQKGMSAYEQSLGGAIQGEQARRLFNIEQQQREVLGQQARDLTIAQLSQAQGLGERQMTAAETYGRMMAQSNWNADSGGGGTVICTELHAQGLMEKTVFESDQAFGKKMKQSRPEVMAGYWVWAVPVTRLMRKSKTITKIVAMIAIPWAHEMAFQMGARPSGSWIGKTLMAVGVPMCAVIGRIMQRRGYGKHGA
jgi:hypothetical protein